MEHNNSSNIKYVLKNHPRNTVVTAKWLVAQGVSWDMIRNYTKTGWLVRIGNGAYRLLDEDIYLDGALATLQTELNLSVHTGAYSALSEVHGKTHNLSFTRETCLFASRGEKLPRWFQDAFRGTYRCHFTSFLPPTLGLIGDKKDGYTVLVSSPERAMLEMLFLCPSVYTPQESFQIMELLVTVKPTHVQELLEQSSSIKTNRLFLYLVETAGHAWIKRLDFSKINLGTGVREIVKGGTYNKKYQLIIDEVRSI